MIKRLLHDTLTQRLRTTQRVILLYGPRQVGKTTLIREVLTDIPGRKLEIVASEVSLNELSNLQLAL